MTHEQVLELVTAEMAGESLDPDELFEVHGHLERCAACRDEAERLAGLWGELDRLEEPAPTGAMRERFAAMLEGATAAEVDPRSKAVAAAPSVVEGPWFRRPLVQVGLNLAAALVGLVVGVAIATDPGPTEDVQLAALQEEVRSLNELVALSLLREGSAVDRIRGARYSGRVAEPDDEMVRTLFATATADPDVNVRLAAVQALGRHATRPTVRHRLIESVQSQTSPLVQIALVETLLASDGDEARAVLGQLLEQPELHPEVRRFILQQIGEAA